MLATSLIAILLFLVAIEIRVSVECECSRIAISVFFVSGCVLVLLTVLLWPCHSALKLFHWGSWPPGIVRVESRWNFVEQLIQRADYLQPVIQAK
ncbi:MAG TPA: hypothetical protein EYP71_00310 [Dehalococcoidia bacterium]|nr:hypothetical protein [Dehalococcoidia bacterium]